VNPARLVGQRVPRVNDHKALRGRGSYVDDLPEPPGLLHAAIVRSPLAHARVMAFRGPPGVLGPDDIDQHIAGELPVLWKLGDQRIMSTPWHDRTARYVGEPIGIALAASRYHAEDLLEAVEVDYDELAVVTDLDAALAPEAPVLHPDQGSNLLATFEAGDSTEHTAAVFAAAPRTLRTELRLGRVHGLALEPRGVLAVPERDGRLTVYTSTQAPHAVRDALCEVLGWPQSRVRIVTPDVGGGFGLKDHLYEDEVLAIVAALATGRPVKWIEDRTEALLATTHARDEHFVIDVAFADDGTLLGLDVTGTRNVGARFGVFGGGPLFTGFGVLPGPYRWAAVRGQGRLVATNTMSTGAYRGFGQTQAAAVRERTVELVAAALGRDPVDLRMQNMIGPDELPYTTRTFLTYDSGDYRRAAARAKELLAAVAPPPVADGRRRGVGYASYVQLAGIGPSLSNELIGLSIGGYETAKVQMEPDGSVRVYSGISPHGQGQETTFAQLVADALGVGLDDVHLVTGDTDSAPYSAYGTAASRSVAVGGGAAVTAAGRVADKLRAIAAEMLEANPADIELTGGRAAVVGTSVGLALGDVAHRAWQGFRLPDGMEPGLVATQVYDPISGTFSYATHACQVAVDPHTGITEVEAYVVVNDCGTVVNPTIVEGQIHGGVAQGLGAALLEEVVYDQNGQPQAATLLDYLVPTTHDLPDIVIEHMETPSPHTPGGMKGMGEGGTNGAFACVLNAVAAAVPELGAAALTTPLTPDRIVTSCVLAQIGGGTRGPSR
jgi:carbon-monoxide dehydrogenase large subunit